MTAKTIAKKPAIIIPVPILFVFSITNAFVDMLCFIDKNFAVLTNLKLPPKCEGLWYASEPTAKKASAVINRLRNIRNSIKLHSS